MAQELRCLECDYLIDVCGECNCYQAFALSDLDQSQRDDYRGRFLELIRHLTRIGLPNLSPDNHDYSEFQWVAGALSLIYYNVHGVNIVMGPLYFDFMETQNNESPISSEPQLAEIPNSVETQVGEGFNPGDKSGHDNSAQEVNNASLFIEESFRSACPVEVHENKDNLNSSSVLLLRLTLMRIFQSHYLKLQIMGQSLDWQQILHDVESNKLELRWTFYKTVIDCGEVDEDNDDDIQEAEEYEYEDEDLGPPPAAVSAIENLATHVISHEQVSSEDAICSICRDMIPLGEEAKELPCRHLHHSECITRWLNIRNFCPLCKYEMPTDDP